MQSIPARTVRLINPVGACVNRAGALAPRTGSLSGKTVGFIDNIKPNAGLFLSYIEDMMRAEFDDLRTQSVRKNFTSSKLIANELDGKVNAVVNAWGD